MTIDTTTDDRNRSSADLASTRQNQQEEALRANMCSHLQQKLFQPDGVYYPIWEALQEDESLSCVVRSRQLHIYRNGKKILVLAGKAQPKVIREDKLNEFIFNSKIQ